MEFIWQDLKHVEDDANDDDATSKTLINDCSTWSSINWPSSRYPVTVAIVQILSIHSLDYEEHFTFSPS